ncbi:hypothetical protein CHS0354_005136 [Potamilus streckersoni]|nr:hypothetical protein CHS0354_005136 [Potamilus streckersoni]
MDHCKHVSKIRPAWNTSILNPQKWLCYVCGTTESAWACLSCANVACGRFNQEHALKHYQESKHPICIEVNEKYVYCYECDDYVLNDNAAGDLKLLRSTLSAITTQSFTDIESRGKRLLRSYSHSGLIARSKTDEDDKQATALWYRRQTLLERVFKAWKNIAKKERKLKTTPKKERVPPTEPSSSLLIKKPTIYPGITGLRNLGNTCYMNSVIQVLSHIEEFRHFYLNLMFDADNSPQTTQQNSEKSSEESPVIRAPPRRSFRLSTTECFEHLVSPLSSKSFNSQKSCGNGGLNGGAAGTTPKRKQQLICTVESPLLSQNVSLCRELHGLLRVLWSAKWAQVSPYAFLSAVWHAIPVFKGYAQHDAQEFLCELLDKVQQELDASTSVIKMTSRYNQQSHSNSKTRSSSRQQQKLLTPSSLTSRQQSSTPTQEKPSISHWFQGELVSKVTCMECGNESQRFEPYLDLSLEFPKRYQITGTNSSLAEDICHITEMLAKFTEEERLEGKIYTCEKCNNNRKSVIKDHNKKSIGRDHNRRSVTKDQQTVYTEAKKQLLIHKLPQILRLHLKRFRWSGRLHREKINTHVAVDDLLDLMPFCSQRTNGKKADYEYKLTGLIMHHGKGFGSGHYTAYVWNNEAASWVHCNDSRLQMVTQEDVLQAQAYIVFYKQSTPCDIVEGEPLAVPLESSESNKSDVHRLKFRSVENISNENMQSSSIQTESKSSTSGNLDSKVNIDCEITFKFPSSDTVPFELQRRKRANKSSTNVSAKIKRRRTTFW